MHIAVVSSVVVPQVGTGPERIYFNSMFIETDLGGLFLCVFSRTSVIWLPMRDTNLGSWSGSFNVSPWQSLGATPMQFCQLDAIGMCLNFRSRILAS